VGLTQRLQHLTLTVVAAGCGSARTVETALKVAAPTVTETSLRFVTVMLPVVPAWPTTTLT
jgi:hypothetical protein